jgi:hypothetical protein
MEEISKMDLSKAERAVMYTIALVAVGSLVAGCTPDIGQAGYQTDTPDNPTVHAPYTPTPRIEATPFPAPTVVPFPSETPKVPETCNLNPQEVAVAGEAVVTAEYSWIDKPLTGWTEAEKKIGENGNPSVYEQVKQLQNTSWVKKNNLTLAGVGIGKGCGFGAVFKNQEGKTVWATTGQNQMLTGEPSGYGSGEGVYVLPEAGVHGDLKLLVGETRELVVTQTTRDQELVVKWFDQISREWKWTEEISSPMNEGKSLEFSGLLTAPVWKETFVGKAETDAGNLEIPIIFGVADAQGSKDKIQSVWMTQKGANAIADAFLREYHYRYSEIMGNKISFEEYKKLLAGQEHGGEILMWVTTEDGKYQQELLDPRRGMSVLITKNIDSMLSTKPEPIRSVFLGVDGEGRLLGATNLYLELDGYLRSRGTSNGSAWFVEGCAGSIIKMINYPDKCLATRNAFGNCGPGQEYDISRDVWRELAAYIDKDAKFTEYILGLVLK